MKQLVIFLSLIFFLSAAEAQVTEGVPNPVTGGTFTPRNNTTATSTANRKDTLGFEHRDDSKDSIAISYRFLDSVRNVAFDSTIDDFDKYYSVPSRYQSLGNNGAAAYSLIFQNTARPGWDAGFHAFDLYRYTLESTKFYRTNRPFTQLNYQLASGKEQMIRAIHTQSPRPNFHFGFDYRLISAPGFFVTQNTNHKSYRVFSNYQGKRKRYAAYFVLVGNTIKASQNGGIQNDTTLDDPNRKKRFSVPVNLGGAALYEPNPFKSNVTTGNIYKDFTFFLRQSYDIGKKDSVAVNDSTTEYLFYPKLRAQYSFTYSTYSYRFQDERADSAVYKNWYNIALPATFDTLYVQDKWRVMTNDFSLLQFPDTKNSAQFLLVGATIQNIKGEFKSGSKNYYNLMLHGEYRNKTRNKKWDVLLKGEFYLNGFNNGDYSAYGTIGRYLNKRFGDIRIFFRNVNRTPSFIFNSNSSFNLNGVTLDKKENITSFGAEANNPFVNLSVANHIITNLAYFTDYYHQAQSSKVINLLQVSASKKIKIIKKLNWYIDATVQQTDGSAPIKVPLLFTRNRFAFEGTYFKNLNLSAGLEVRYFTPYEAYNYSPVMGQFTPQDSMLLKNLPDVSAFFHFRIKSFTGYIRAENLNTVSFKNGFGFTNNNFAAPHYPTPGLMIRFGIQWGFVN